MLSAVLMSVCCQDCEEAISALIQGAAWEEALRLVSLFFYACPSLPFIIIRFNVYYC